MDVGGEEERGRGKRGSAKKNRRPLRRKEVAEGIQVDCEEERKDGERKEEEGKEESVRKRFSVKVLKVHGVSNDAAKQEKDAEIEEERREDESGEDLFLHSHRTRSFTLSSASRNSSLSSRSGDEGNACKPSTSAFLL